MDSPPPPGPRGKNLTVCKERGQRHTRLYTHARMRQRTFSFREKQNDCGEKLKSQNLSTCREQENHVGLHQALDGGEAVGGCGTSIRFSCNNRHVRKQDVGGVVVDAQHKVVADRLSLFHNSKCFFFIICSVRFGANWADLASLNGTPRTSLC